MNDTIGDMLNRIYTNGAAGRSTTTFPATKITESIASVLESEGYIASYSKKGKKTHKHIEVEILYNTEQGVTGGSRKARPKIQGFKRVSKPSQRVYAGVRDIKPFREGYGMRVLSTPRGVLSDKNARQESVGGEVLFEIW